MVNPLFKHPDKGWCTQCQYDQHKSYCITALQDHQPRTAIKTYVLEYEDV